MRYKLLVPIGEEVTERDLDWNERATTQWSLRTDDGKVMLMTRTADEEGLDAKGQPQTWLDVATFRGYHYARAVLEALQRDAEHQVAVKNIMRVEREGQRPE